MELLQNFVLQHSKHEVRMIWEGDKPLFRAEDIGKVLGLKKFRNSITKFDEDEKEAHDVGTPGGVQKVLYLTEQGVYRILFRSNKEIAEPFKKWVVNVIAEIRKKGFYEMKEGIKEEYEEKLKQSEEKAKELVKEAIEETSIKVKEESFYASLDHDHTTLVNAFENTCVIYFGFVKMIDNKQLVKIGSTEDLRTRAYDLKDKFGNIMFFRVFPSELYRQYEKELQSHRLIKPYKYEDIVHNGHTSREAYLMTQDQVNTAINVAIRRKHKFRQQIIAHNEVEKEKMKLEFEKIKLENHKLDLEEKKLKIQGKIQTQNRHLKNLKKSNLMKLN